MHNLEHGGIVIHYLSGTSPEIVEQLKEFVQGLRADIVGLVLAPRVNLPAPIVLSAWEYYLPLLSYDEEAMNVFVRAHYDQAPEALGGGQ